MTTDTAFGILNWMTLILCGGLLGIAIIATYLYLFDKVIQLLRLKRLFWSFLVACRQIIARAKEMSDQKTDGPHPVKTCDCPICTEFRATTKRQAQELFKDPSSEGGCNE